MQPDAAPTPAEAPSPGAEVVSRPAAGTLARGVWEAPPWAFYAGIAAVLASAVLYLAWRAGRLRRRTRTR